jgi:hypothetical protein
MIVKYIISKDHNTKYQVTWDEKNKLPSISTCTRDEDLVDTIFELMNLYNEIADICTEKIPKVNISLVDYLTIVFEKMVNLKTRFICIDDVENRWMTLTVLFRVLMAGVNMNSGALYNDITTKCFNILVMLVPIMKSIVISAGMRVEQYPSSSSTNDA